MKVSSQRTTLTLMHTQNFFQLHLRRFTLLAGLLALTALAVSAAEDRRERVLKDREEVGARADWVYNDLPKGIAEAARTGKPLFVVIRCIP